LFRTTHQDKGCYASARRSRRVRESEKSSRFGISWPARIPGPDSFIVVSVTFQLLYVFVILDIGTRRVVHWNLTEHLQWNGPCGSFGKVFFRMALLGFSSTNRGLSFCGVREP